MSKTLICTTEAYRGHDHGDGDRAIYVNEGETFEVSDLKAAQLLEDFPGWFADASPSKGKKASAPAPQAEPTDPPADEPAA